MPRVIENNYLATSEEAISWSNNFTIANSIYKDKENKFLKKICKSFY